MLPNYMNMGKDWKNRRRHMVTGETLGMEQSIPVAISRETRVSEIQHFIWVSVKQLRSCTKLSLQAPFAAPQRPGCAPELSVMDRTRLQVQRSELPRRIQGGTEESPWTRALTRRGAATAQGARGAVGAMRKLPFGPTAQGSFNATLLRSLDFCTCPHVLPPLSRRRFWPEWFTRGHL